MCKKNSALDDAFAFCTLCRSNVNILHGGRDDLRKHCSTQKHLNAASAAKLQPPSSSFVAKDCTAEVTRTKLLFMSFQVEHNVALSASDHAESFRLVRIRRCENADYFSLFLDLKISVFLVEQGW